MESVETRLDRLQSQVDTIAEGVGRIEAGHGGILDAHGRMLHDHGQMLRGLTTAVARIETRLSDRLVDHETRIEALEKNARSQ